MPRQRLKSLLRALSLRSPTLSATCFTLCSENRSSRCASAMRASFRCSTNDFPVVLFRPCASHDSETPSALAASDLVSAEFLEFARMQGATAPIARPTFCRACIRLSLTSAVTPRSIRRSASECGWRVPARSRIREVDTPRTSVPASCCSRRTTRAPSITRFSQARSIM